MTEIKPLSSTTTGDVDLSPSGLANYRMLTWQAKRKMILALFVERQMTQAEIARAIGVHESRVSRALTVAGIEPRKGKSAPAKSVDVPTAKRRVPSETLLRVKERINEALLPLSRAERAEVLAWASDALVSR